MDILSRTEAELPAKVYLLRDDRKEDAWKES
jgi:hypothetical protein